MYVIKNKFANNSIHFKNAQVGLIQHGGGLVVGCIWSEGLDLPTPALVSIRFDHCNVTLHYFPFVESI